jgi:hypothetical protein
MQSGTGHLGGDPPISDLEQGRTPLAHVGQPVMITVIKEFGALFFREVEGQTLGHLFSPGLTSGSTVPLSIPD